MPTYEYACTQCGQHVEVFQRLSDEPLSTCGVCGGLLRKVFHPAGILFKGSGFYSTDNRAKPKGSGTKEGAAKSGSSAEGTGGGSGAAGGADKSTSGGEKTSAGTAGQKEKSA